MLRSEESEVDGGDAVDTVACVHPGAEGSHAGAGQGRPSIRTAGGYELARRLQSCRSAEPDGRQIPASLAREDPLSHGWIYGYDAELAVSRSA